MKLVTRNFLAFLAAVLILSMIIPTVAFAADGEVTPLSVSSKASSLTVSGRTLTIKAYTQSYILEDVISVTSTLQMKNGSSWADVYTWPTVTAYNTLDVSLSKTYTGTSGKTYRVKSTHYTKSGSTTDTETSYSSEVTVS